MIFSQIEYFWFFGIVFTLYWAVPRRARLWVLVPASLLFYGTWNFKYLLLLLATTGLDYFSAIEIDRNTSARVRKAWFVGSLTANLGILAVFKYYGFFAHSLVALGEAVGLNVHLTTLNLFLTMLLGGLWHGANWTFVVWGGLHGAALAVHKVFLERFAGRPGLARTRETLGWRAFAGLLTFVFVCLCFVLFRATTFGHAIDYFAGLFSPQSGRRLVDLGAVVPIFLFATATLLDARFRFATWYPRIPWPLRSVGYAAAALLLLLLTPTTQVPFVYFQF